MYYFVLQFSFMKKESRHVCCYCGAKRIKSRMQVITVSDRYENLHQGAKWLCIKPGTNCFMKYHEGELAYYSGQTEKIASAMRKFTEYGAKRKGKSFAQVITGRK